MRVYILKRLLLIIPTVLMITLVVFVMMRSIPGDPVVALLGDAYTEEDAVRVREGYGLDRPVIVQYLIWLGKLVQGDWGTSILSGRPVLQDGPWDMYVEDLLSLITLDSNGYLSNSTSVWSHPRHNDPKVDEYYSRYARELDPAKRKVIAKELVEFMADKMYWNNISGSPFYMVAQPWMKGYTYNAEFEVHYDKVWLDK